MRHRTQPDYEGCPESVPIESDPDAWETSADIALISYNPTPEEAEKQAEHNRMLAALPTVPFKRRW